jgi:hypothetical protein
MQSKSDVADITLWGCVVVIRTDSLQDAILMFLERKQFECDGYSAATLCNLLLCCLRTASCCMYVYSVTSV